MILILRKACEYSHPFDVSGYCEREGIRHVWGSRFIEHSRAGTQQQGAVELWVRAYFMPALGQVLEKG